MTKLIIIFFALICLYEFGWAGPPACIPDAQCPSKGNFLKKGIIPCDADCKNQHGASSGACRANFCCYCGTITGKRKKFSAQCRTRSKGDVRTAYQELCDLDCKCNHGAINGTCNYKNQACICGIEAQENACKATPAEIQAIIKKYKFANIFG